MLRVKVPHQQFAVSEKYYTSPFIHVKLAPLNISGLQDLITILVVVLLLVICKHLKNSTNSEKSASDLNQILLVFRGVMILSPKVLLGKAKTLFLILEITEFA